MDFSSPTEKLSPRDHLDPFSSERTLSSPECHCVDEFYLVITTGEDTDNAYPQISPLLQVMPWPTCRNMTKLELRAVYEFLSAVPPVSVSGGN